MSNLECPSWVPIFPLPNAVLLPRVVLPLHVFEARYRQMTEDALAGDRLIAIALLKPGFEAQYHTLDAEIHPDICVGRILREERLTDGRFNFLLQGITRAKVLNENKERPYRRARIAPVVPRELQPNTECEIRRNIRRLLEGDALRPIATEANWIEMLKCSSLTLSDVIDVVAAAVLTECEDKQCFLSNPCVEQRGRCLCEVLKSIAGQIEQAQTMKQCRNWPPDLSEN